MGSCIQKRFVDWKTTANNNGIMVFYVDHDVFFGTFKVEHIGTTKFAQSLR
jgi:hypothetical protein